MAFKKPTVKNTIVDIAQARIYLRSVKKFGKTTLFRDVILEKYGDPECGVLLGIGSELGYNLLDDLNTAQIESWKDLMEFKRWILSDDESAKKVKMVAFDTIDELIPIVEKEVCRKYELESGKRGTINGAYGGYGAGQDMVKDMIKKFFYDLHKAGKGVFAIAHTKFKTIKEKGLEDTEGYQVLTSNLQSNYEGIFGDIFDIVLTGNIDREVENKVTKNIVRKLYFRGNSFVDAGGRFSPDAVPEYMIFEGDAVAKEFVKIIEEGMRKSKRSASLKDDDKEYEKYKKDTLKEATLLAEAEAEVLAAESETSVYAEVDGVAFLQKNFKENKDFANNVKKIIVESGVKKASDLSQEDLTKIVKMGVEEFGFSI